MKKKIAAGAGLLLLVSLLVSAAFVGANETGGPPTPTATRITGKLLPESPEELWLAPRVDPVKLHGKALEFTGGKLLTVVDNRGHLECLTVQIDYDCAAVTASHGSGVNASAQFSNWDSCANWGAFSPTWIYVQRDPPQGDGMSISNAIRIVQNTGHATVDRFPYRYPADPINETNSAWAIPFRAKTRVLLLSWTKPATAEDIQVLKDWIITHEMFLLGMPVYEGFIDPPGGYISMPTPGEQPWGNHGVLAIGFNDDQSAPGGGWFIIANSYGTGWGDQGFGYLPYGYFLEVVEAYAYGMTDRDDDCIYIPEPTAYCPATPAPTSTTTATPTPTVTPTATPTSSPTATATATPTATPSPTGTPTITPTSTPTATPTPTPTHNPTPTSTPTATGTPIPEQMRIFLPLLVKG